MQCSKCGNKLSNNEVKCPCCGHIQYSKRSKKQSVKVIRYLSICLLVSMCLFLIMLSKVLSADNDNSQEDVRQSEYQTLDVHVTEEDIEVSISSTQDSKAIEDSSLAVIEETKPFDQEEKQHLVLYAVESTSRGEIKYYYNTEGKIVYSTDTFGDSISKYTYHENGELSAIATESPGNCTWETTQYRDDGTVMASIKHTYEYGSECGMADLIFVEMSNFDEHGNVVVYEVTTYCYDFPSRMSYKYDCAYDMQGRLVERITYFNDGDYNEIMDTEVYIYNDDGSYRHELNSRNIWIYDQYGNCVQELDNIGEDDSVESVYEYEHMYDDGKLIKTVKYNSTVTRENAKGDGNIGFYEKIMIGYVEYQYDDSGRLLSKYTYAENGAIETETWVYDDQGNLLVHIEGNEETRYTYVPLKEALYKS